MVLIWAKKKKKLQRPGNEKHKLRLIEKNEINC